jgi:hypothetical protein
MKSKFIITATILVIVCIAVFSSAMQLQPEIIPVNPLFGKYISGYTSGMTSRIRPIRIELAYNPNQEEIDKQMKELAKKDSLAALNKTVTTESLAEAIANATRLYVPDSSLLKDIFSFEPAIKGKAVWVSDRIIEFIPAEPLPVNQFYNATFRLNQVMEVPKEYRKFKFQFSTYPQSINVTVDALRSYDDYNIEWQKLSGSISCSDFEDSSLIKKTLMVYQDGKKKKVTWGKGYNNNEFFFYVDSVERKIKQGLLTVEWNGEPVKAMQQGKKDVVIPALGDFTVTEVTVVDQEDQYVRLSFSDPIDPSQNLKGIVSISGIDNLTYSIEGNYVSVFLPNRTVGEKTITVSTGVKNFKGYKMNTAFSQPLTFEEPKPFVRIKGKGSILPNSKGLIFPFEAISLKAVDVRIIKIFENNVHQFLQVNSLSEGDDGLTRVGKIVAEKTIKLDYDKKMDLKQWNTHVIDLGKLISPDPGAIYRVSIKFNKSYAVCDCPADPEEENTENGETQAEVSSDDDNYRDKNWSEDDWNRYGFDGGYESWDYYYNESASACSNDYYYGKAVSRNILASDLGLIYKLDENKMSHAFVSDMITAKPLPNATVEYLDYTKQLIASGTTDVNGMLDVQLKRKPFLMLARYGKQRGYLKLLDGYNNSLSKFDIEGEVVQKGVKGFIYGERGVWRPGDSLFLTFIMEDKEHRLPANHPVKFELQDPNGQLVYQTTKTKNVNGMYDFRTATSDEAVTGDYLATARVGNRVFTQSLKIETVKPNRLKIYFDTDNAKDSTALLKVKWLHGAVAKDLEATVSVSIHQGKTKFDGYKNYVFDSPIRDFHTEAVAIFNGPLDEKGEAHVAKKLDVGKTAPGKLSAIYVTRVYEEGGDFSIDRYPTTYSPYDTYIGLKLPETKNYDNTFETGQNYTFDVAALTSEGKPVTAKKLQVKVYKIQWRWWYERDQEDLSDYVSRTGTICLKDTLIAADSGKGNFKFKVNYPEYGRYLVTVTDLEGGHQTGKVMYIDWPYWSRANRSNNENANMLNFACDKEKYTAGENIKLSFPSPSDGMALVSVETSKRVVKKFWIATKKGETTYEFPASKEMAPNAFLHVTLIQPHASTTNDLPIRMYGVVPVLVDDPATHLEPVIHSEDVAKPESQTTIKVSEKSGRKMNYTLAIVDEGLLDLTRFKTPQPWNTFYAREALGVQTWDMYDDVIGAYAGKLDKLLSIGGDGEGNSNKGAKANRFKPMVKFVGPFTLEAGEQRSHKIGIPNYVGSVRVMVVAENEGAYGNAEKVMAVRKPLMILATLPRVLGPMESVSLPVDVFAMEKQVKDVKVEVEVNELLTIDGEKTKTMHFTEVGDDVINFKLNVAEKTGIAKVKVIATCGKERSTQEIELDVRTPNPKVVDGMEVTLEPGKSWDADIKFKGIVGTNQATIEFSTIPQLGLEKRMDYLIRYPHGCIEQTTSSAFPQLYVSNLLELNDKQKEKISKNIKAGLKRLQYFQTANGGFSYWPGEGYDSEWGSNYAGHFMIEAEKQGYSLPANMKSKWIKFQQEEAKSWAANNGTYTHPHGNETNECIQAYRLFVLALANHPELAAMNRLREEKNLSATAKWRLAAAYNLVGQNEVAKNLIVSLPTKVPQYKELSYSYGSDVRDKAMILETLSLMDEKTLAAPVAKEVARTLNSKDWLSTQETAYSLLAMCEYAGVKGANGSMSFSYALNGGDAKTQTSKKSMCQVKYNDKDISKTGLISLKNTSNITLFAKVIVEGVPLIGDKTASFSNLNMEIKYKDMSGKEIQPDKIQQGTDFIAEVKITNPGKKGFLREMALNQVFPGGWEIHNSRMDGTETGTQARYQDIRDDRVYSYYELAENSSKTFVIQLNATYLGKFYLPTLYSEAMYDNLINARIPGKWVEVVKDPIPVAKK